MISNARPSLSVRPILVASLFFLIVGGAGQADTQYCMSYDPPDPFDTSSNCQSMPGIDRTFQPVVQDWHGSSFLIHSRGNELEYLSLGDPQNPALVDQSDFDVGNMGDSDYDLKYYAVCDDCRYGYSVHTMATVFFDLGTAASPSFSGFEKRNDYPDLRGGMTFKHEGTQYLVLDGIRNDDCDGTSGLFVVNGTDPDAFQLLECVYKPNLGNFKVVGGIYLQDNRYNNGDAYLWVSDSYQFHIYKILKPGGASSLHLLYVNPLDFGTMAATSRGGVAVDYDRGMAVTTSYTEGFKVWQFSSLQSPQLSATLPNVDADWVTLGDGVAVAGSYGSANPLFSFELSNPANPVPLDPDYWDVGQPWNDLPCRGWNLGGVFSRDGDFLFLSRWERMQRHDIRDCAGPQAPTARVTLGRWNGSVCSTLVGSVFPGDEICAVSESSGEITSTDLWITDAAGATVASTSGGATAGPLPYTIPVGGSGDEPSSNYTGHVRVSNDVGETEDTVFSLVDLTPEATINSDPGAPLTGEVLTLAGEAEGSPGLPDGSGLPDPFEWTITEPSGGGQMFYGQNPPPVVLSEAGLYEIGLTVYYRHGAATPYVATSALNLEISSVSAAFTVVPFNPVTTEDVVLDGSQSRWSAGVTPDWQWEYRPNGDGWQDLTSVCGAAQNCTINGSHTTQFFTEGTYDFRLTLTNDLDVSIAQVTDIDIADGTVDLEFSWDPTNPEIGQDVAFHVEGVPVVDSVMWNFGGANCDGSVPQNWTCVPSLYFDCLSVPYAYASGGNKAVSLSAVVDGRNLGPINHTVSVANTGSCGGGGGGGGGGGTTCTYIVSPTLRTVPATGGTGYTVSVSTQAGCAWVASENSSWISISSGSSGSGSGVVMYSVAPNTGSTRTGLISAAGKSHTVTQTSPTLVDFTVSPAQPDIGEQVTFTVSDPRVTPIRWEFDGAHCDGSSAVLDCAAAPSACLSIPWEYAQAGWKAVRLVAQEGEKTRGVLVANSGECCPKDGPPNAVFTMTPNPAFTREDVVFADDSFKSDEIESPKTTALGFTWDPAQPAVGDRVTFTITGVGAVNSTEWNMGSVGCGTYEQITSCTPNFFIDCMTWFYEYGSAGAKTVTLTINGGTQVSNTITVLDGTCDGSGCTYSISPSLKSFDQNGGEGTITVSTGAGCEWTATEASSWISITGGSSGSGSGTVSYSVAPNTGAARTANIAAAGKTHSVRQAAYEGPQDTGATAWNWTVSLGGTTIVTSNQPTFTYSFGEPGLYNVRYEVSNCRGSDVEFGQLVVEEAAATIPEEYLVSSAVHAHGLNGTRWRSDIRIFNPDVEPVQVEIKYLPENTDNTAGLVFGITFNISPRGTRAYDDILQVIPGIVVNDSGSYSGALSITYSNGGEEEVPPQIVSRTYNETPDGTFGQFVPAVPVPPGEDDRLFLTGLVHNLYYRTNIRLANMSNESVVATITLFDRYGDPLGNPLYPTVLPRSTTQVNAVVEAAGISTFVDGFSVQVDTGSPEVSGWASVVDNQNGDPVLYSSMVIDEEDTKLWVSGVAHLAGINDSEWRTDITFFNAKSENISFDVAYVPSEDLGILPYFQIRGVQPGEVLSYLDILGNSMLPAGVESKGYFVIEGFGGSRLPHIAARTYNVDLSGGTFGQNLFVFREGDLLPSGSVGYVPGVMVSETNNEGFRSNIGVLNTAEAGWADVKIRLLDSNGGTVGDTVILSLAPGRFLQFNLADRLNLPPVNMNGTVIVDVLSGGPVAAYASVVDNQTQDPILIPAIPDITPLTR